MALRRLLHAARSRQTFGSLAAFAMVPGSLFVLAADDPAATQITVFDHVGTQTSSQYYSPTLNQPEDFTSPIDYAGGRVYVRVDVLDKPSDASMIPQLCFWRHTESTKFKYETCAFTKKFAFSKEGVVWIDAGTPNSWYKKNGVWDWSEPASLGRIMLKDPVSGKLWLSSRCGAACYRGDDIEDHIPVRLDAEVIFVANGAQLDPPTSWKSSCPTAWSSLCSPSDPSTTPATTTPSTTTPATTTPSTTTPDVGSTGTTYRVATRHPMAPSLTATRNTTSILSTWTPVASATKYQFRLEDSSGNRTWKRPQTDLSYLTTELDADQPYEVAARALVAGTWRPWTTLAVPNTPNPDDQPPDTTVPTTSPATGDPMFDGPVYVQNAARSTTPTVSAERDGTSMLVNWSIQKESSLFQFRIRDSAGKLTWQKPSGDRSIVLSDLDPNAAYDVSVRAHVAGQWRGWTTLTVPASRSVDQPPVVAPPTTTATPPTTTPSTTTPSTTTPATSTPPTTAPPTTVDPGSGHDTGGHISASSGQWLAADDEVADYTDGRTRTRYAFFDPADKLDENWTASRVGFMVECASVGFAQVDPIVNPGMPQSAHPHEFFGNPLITPHLTTQALIDVPRSEIDCTDQNDKSAYWTPAVYQDGERVPSEKFKAYYKSTTTDAVPMPLGLRMVAGDASATRNQSELVGGWVGEGNKNNDLNTFGSDTMIEISDSNVNLTLRVNFPNCWDGIHLDSPDHKSHMAYFNERTLSCPSTHPVKLTQLTTFTQYDTKGGSGFTLASGEWFTFHQDFWNGWSPDQMSDLTERCIGAAMNCRLKTTPMLEALGQQYEYVPA